MNCKYIKGRVEQIYGIEDLAINNRKREITEKRAVYYKLCSVYADDYTQDKCGQVVGKHHSTVIHGLKTFLWFIDSSGWELHKRYYSILKKEFTKLRWRPVAPSRYDRIKYNRSLTHKAR